MSHQYHVEKIFDISRKSWEPTKSSTNYGPEDTSNQTVYENMVLWFIISLKKGAPPKGYGHIWHSPLEDIIRLITYLGNCPSKYCWSMISPIGDLYQKDFFFFFWINDHFPFQDGKLFLIASQFLHYGGLGCVISQSSPRVSWPRIP